MKFEPEVLVADLRLDEKNPRLPEGSDELSQDELARLMAEQFLALDIARSIVRHGYFLSEPLIVEEIENHGGLRVLEGNRRLSALMLLENPERAAGLAEAQEWRDLAHNAVLPKTLPALVVQDREEVVSIIGYRHITGIEEWEPYAKARFIAGLVENQDRPRTLDEVADLIGDDARKVRESYRNYKIVQHAEAMGINSKRLRDDRFGVFTRAMQSPGIIGYVGAAAAWDVEEGAQPIPDNKVENLQWLVTWLAGDEGGKTPVVSDSRKITELSRVVSHPRAEQTLRRTGSLDEASVDRGAPLEILTGHLSRAKRALEAALLVIGEQHDHDEVRALLDACDRLLDELRNDA